MLFVEPKSMLNFSIKILSDFELYNKIQSNYYHIENDMSEINKY